MEDTDRESQVNFIDVCKLLWGLSMIIIFQQLHQSTWKTSPAACVGSRFNVALTET